MFLFFCFCLLTWMFILLRIRPPPTTAYDDDRTMTDTKKDPRVVVDFSWAFGKIFFPFLSLSFYSLIFILFRQRRRLPPFKPRKYCNVHDKGPNDGLPSIVVFLLLLLLFTNIYLLSDYVRRQRMVITTITYHCDDGTTAGDRSTPPAPTTTRTNGARGASASRVPVFFFFFHCTKLYY